MQWTKDKKLLDASGRGCLTGHQQEPHVLMKCSHLFPLILHPCCNPQAPEMSLVAIWHVSFPSKGLLILALQKLAMSLTEDSFSGLWDTQHLTGWRALCGSQKRCHDNLHTDESGRESRPLQSHPQTSRTFTHCCSGLRSGESTLEAKLQLKAGTIFSVFVHTHVRGPWFTFGLPVNYSPIWITISWLGSALQPAP